MSAAYELNEALLEIERHHRAFIEVQRERDLAMEHVRTLQHLCADDEAALDCLLDLEGHLRQIRNVVG